MPTTVIGLSPRLLHVECTAEAIVVRGLVSRRRIPLDRVIGITFWATIVWCSKRGRVRRKWVWFFGPGKGADPSYRYRVALADWVCAALRNQKGFDSKMVHHLSEQDLRDRLRLARCGAAWSRRRSDSWAVRNLSLWQSRVARLETEAARRAG